MVQFVTRYGDWVIYINPHQVVSVSAKFDDEGESQDWCEIVTTNSSNTYEVRGRASEVQLRIWKMLPRS